MAEKLDFLSVAQLVDEKDAAAVERRAALKAAQTDDGKVCLVVAQTVVYWAGARDVVLDAKMAAQKAVEMAG